ncbi:MAG: hypothetical protein KUG79_14240 [Pseudomonadales bacterium]|nr:hypothetical protein [Pseudomonadales bacterium]
MPRWILPVNLMLVVGILLFNFQLTAAAAISTTASTAPSKASPTNSAIDAWRPWIEEKHPDLHCPWTMTKRVAHACNWPGQLSLNLHAKGLSFTLNVTVFGKRGFIALPGDQKHWPINVSIDGKPAPVLEKNNLPVISLTTGEFIIRGNFQWQSKPTALTVPPSIAQVQVTQAGKLLDLNRRENKVLFSQGLIKPGPQKQDRIKIEVYRLLRDGVPQTLETRVKLSVAGKPGEIKIGRLALADSTTIQLTSPLPARIETDGDLRIQVVAGEHSIRLLSRFDTDVSSLNIETRADPWPKFETLSFKAETDIRQLRITGAQGIDTSQISLPPEWRNLPTYQMNNDSRLQLTTEYRGDQTPPANQLQVQRNLWLDFDGTGITSQDLINGQMYRDWRLDAQPDTQVGSATVANEPVLITTDKGNQGIEIRSPEINLKAVTRILNPEYFSAIGWQSRADTWRATLHLPPGWRVLHAQGVDSIRGSWISQWDLWDIFLLLIIVAASYRLLGLSGGLVAAATLIITYHEPNAPIVIYPVLLLLIALLPILTGRLRILASIVGGLSIAMLVVSLVLFSVAAFRLAIYPSLEKVRVGQYQLQNTERREMATASRLQETMDKSINSPSAISDNNVSGMNVSDNNYSIRSAVMKRRRSDRQQTDLYQLDQDDRLQTGPGLPTWLWQAVNLRSSGPLVAEQNLAIYYSTPIVTSLWRVASVLLLVLYALMVILPVARQLKTQDKNKPLVANPTAPVLLILGIISATLLPSADLSAAPYPPAYLLQQLEQKLLKPPPCLPACASISQGSLTASKNTLTLEFAIYAAVDVSLPLPSSETGWQATTISMDGNQRNATQRQQGIINMMLPSGHHHITLSGPLTGEQITINVPVPIHNFSAHSNHWTIEGVIAGRIINNTLVLRSQAKNTQQNSLRPNPVSPLVSVNREFIFGKQWQIITRVERIAPTKGPIAVKVPLYSFEKVLTDKINIQDGMAHLQFNHNQQYVSWVSSLEPTENLMLVAQQSKHFIETWRITPSSLWRLSYQGIPSVKESGTFSTLQPLWRPWPGETLDIDISRPEGVKGAIHTVEKATLKYNAGQDIQRSELTLNIQSSLGEVYEIILPGDAELLSVTLEGKQLNLPTANIVKVPLQPGPQTLYLAFQQHQSTGWQSKTPEILLPQGAANINIEYALHRDRWPLFASGPAIGPALLYWGMLTVIIFAAIILSMLAQKLALEIPVTLTGWLLLGIGLSTVNSYGILVVASFFFLLALRKQKVIPQQWSRKKFNGLQMLIIALTVLTIIIFISAIPLGLLSNPDMKVVGNGSTSHLYKYYQDRAPADNFPIVSLTTVSLLSYRLVMLLWSLWLATRIIHWASWWWQCYSHQGSWRKKE